MKIILHPEELQNATLEFKQSWPNSKIGLVPTMGALHEGHKTLLNLCCKQSELSILSVFVNPTQFNDPEDLKKYPRAWDQDLAMAEACGVDIVFSPEFEMMYPDQYSYQIVEKNFSKLLCGQNRPGHFDGVLSIVMKLLNLSQADLAFFGEKDFQQLKLIEGMIKSFFMKTKIVRVPTIRAESGLALSSRNMRLNAEELKKAPQLHKILESHDSVEVAKEKLSALGFEVDYLTEIDGRRYAAAQLGKVRLIDNVEI